MHLPGMHMPKLGLNNVESKFVDERQGLVCWRAFDGDAFALAHIETSAPCIRMRTHDWMHHIWLLRA